jgi:hypothetical protein
MPPHCLRKNATLLTAHCARFVFTHSGRRSRRVRNSPTHASFAPVHEGRVVANVAVEILSDRPGWKLPEANLSHSSEPPYLNAALAVETDLYKKPNDAGLPAYPDRLCNPPLPFAKRRQIPPQSCDQLRALLVRGIIPRRSMHHHPDSITA